MTRLGRLDGDVLVAEDAGAVCAFGAFDAESGEVRAVYVQPDAGGAGSDAGSSPPSKRSRGFAG